MNTDSEPLPPVLFELLPSTSNNLIGLVTLNAEKSLNSLNISMVNLLLAQLKSWQEDENIVAIFMQGAGEKAFCAGGDIVQMYKDMEVGNDGCFQFFKEEYQLDYLIHQYTKPIIVWGHGIVMGGGMGIMNGASHRIVTERTRMAMPEVTIGLYPDVGASYFLNKAPEGVGLFLGMTGVKFNATDALFANFADFMMLSSQKEQFINGLLSENWSNDSSEHYQQIEKMINALQSGSINHEITSNIEDNYEAIQNAMQPSSLLEKVEAIKNLKGINDWFDEAVTTLEKGCPITLYLVDEQIKRGKGKSLADIFRMELIMSTQCSLKGNLKEGVRALLIDKDNNPKFNPSTLEEVTTEDVEEYFTPPWEGKHPLLDM